MKEIVISADQYLVLVNCSGKTLNKDRSIIVEGSVYLPEDVTELPDIKTTFKNELYVSGNKLDKLVCTCEGFINITDRADIKELYVDSNGILVEYSNIEDLNARTKYFDADNLSSNTCNVKATAVANFSMNQSDIKKADITVNELNITGGEFSRLQLDVSSLSLKSAEVNSTIDFYGPPALDVKMCGMTGCESLNIPSKYIVLEESEVRDLHIDKCEQIILRDNANMDVLNVRGLSGKLVIEDQKMTSLTCNHNNIVLTNCVIDEVNSFSKDKSNYITSENGKYKKFNAKIDTISLDKDNIEEANIDTEKLDLIDVKSLVGKVTSKNTRIEGNTMYMDNFDKRSFGDITLKKSKDKKEVDIDKRIRDNNLPEDLFI